MKDLHKEFVRLGRERNRITYKLLALLPKIDELKIYEREGYANVYDYAAKIAGLSPGVVTKALKVNERLQEMPHLQKVVETQGINKVGIVAGLATNENEEELAEKVENMSKFALQEYSKEKRGKTTLNWQVELDEDMMFIFLKLKKKFGKNLSNKECLRKILEKMQENLLAQKREQKIGREKSGKRSKSREGKYMRSRRQAEKSAKIPGEKSSRYISIHKKRKLGEKCAHPGCHRPAEVIHHVDRFSEYHNHDRLEPLCREHHEFAHNGITEPMRTADRQYRRYRRAALV